MLAFSEFARLAQQGNYVPVTLTLTADLETPVSILSRLKDDENVFLLESVEAGERFGRNSFIGLNPRARFSVEDGRAFVEDADGRRELPEAATKEGAFMALRSLTEGLRPAAPADLPAFTGGAVGALGWEMCGEFEPKTGYKPHGLTAAFMVAEDMIIFDNFRHTMTISAGVRIDEFPDLGSAFAAGAARVEAVRARIRRPLDLSKLPDQHPAAVPVLKANTTEHDFCAMVEKAKGLIRDGELIQVVLSQKFSGETTIEPFTFYRALRRINPSPYTFFMKMGGLTFVSSSPEKLPDQHPAAVPVLKANTTEHDFCAMVEKAKGLIRDGELIQVVLSQKFSGETTIEPFTFYRALRRINPSPYTFFMKMGGLTFVSSSPETLCRTEADGSALLRPIAGTRKRGASAADDERLSEELLADPKERAEHLMLVDLARNDLGRVAAPGSVKTPSFMTVEYFSHVMHIVSTVTGRLAPGLDAYDLVRSAFPAGTLSGAPKVRAMQIIRELEPEPRGFYGGAAGYFGYDGAMDLAITIRTLIFEDLDDPKAPGGAKRRNFSIQAGAGIVYDSVPALEYKETKNKAAAMMKAVELAARGLAD